MIFTHLDQISSQEFIPGFQGKPIHTEGMTLVYWEVQEGAVLPEHHHVHEQVANVLSGEFELTVGGKTQVMRKGDIAIIPSNATHSGRALSACEILDIFRPARADYK